MTDARADLILVADDNDAKRYVVVRWLQRAGYQVIEASTGVEALSLSRRLPDLIVLDVRLPDISGFEVCRQIKRDARTSHVPVVHLSAHVTSSADKVYGLDGGADAYLSHPVDAEELVATIHALLRVRRAESELRESEERFRLVARATNDAVWDWDVARDEVHWNDAAMQLFLTREPIGITPLAWWQERIHPDDRPRVVAGQRTALEGRGDKWFEEYRLLRADGRVATVLDRGSISRDERGRAIRFIGSMLDVTHRRESEHRQAMLAEVSRLLSDTLAEEALLERFARFAVRHDLAEVCLVREVGSLGVGRVLAAATAAGSVTALDDASRPVGREQDWLSRVVRSGIAEIGAWHDVVADAPQRMDAASHHLGPALAAPLRARGRTLGVAQFARASGSLRYDEDDRRFLEELCGRAALALDNARLYEEAVIANQAKADFLAVMSHELRTPLNAIVGYIDLMRLGLGGVSTQASLPYLERMDGASKRLLQLIEQVLTLSRAEADREPVAPVWVEVRPLVEEIVELVSPAARAKRLELLLDVRCRSIVVETEPAMVRQILLNLLSNAVKFTDAGRVDVVVDEIGEELEFRVLDTGIGIADEHHQRVFDSFWLVERRKSRRADGSGVGLAVSRHLARQLGGDLSVASRLGDGSCFALRIPTRFRAPAGLMLPPLSRRLSDPGLRRGLDEGMA